MTTALALALPWYPRREGKGRDTGEGLGAQDGNVELEKGGSNRNPCHE